MHRILLVDDHPYIRVGIRSLLTNAMLVKEVYEASNLHEAEKALSEHPVDLVICDISLGEESGIDLLKRWGSEVSFVMLSIFEAHIYIDKCMSLGAKAYLAKGTDPKELLQTVDKVLQEIPLHKPISVKSDSGQDILNNLSAQERNVLMDLVQGLGMRDISSKRNLGYTTVATYRKRILDKTGLENTNDLIRMAIKMGLIHP